MRTTFLALPAMPHSTPWWRKPLVGHTEAVNALGAVDGRAVVVSGGQDTTIRLWDARTGEPISQPFAGHTDAVRAIALGAVDGCTAVVSVSRDGTIRLWDARTHRELSTMNVGTRLMSIAFDAAVGIVTGLATGVLCLELQEAEGDLK